MKSKTILVVRLGTKDNPNIDTYIENFSQMTRQYPSIIFIPILDDSKTNVEVECINPVLLTPELYKTTEELVLNASEYMKTLLNKL